MANQNDLNKNIIYIWKSNAYQGCINVIKNTVKTVIVWNIIIVIQQFSILIYFKM